MSNSSDAIERAEKDYAHNKKVSDDLRLLRAYRRVFRTADGMAILEDLKKSCCFNRSTLAQGPELVQYHEGRRSVILSILDLMDRDISKLHEQLTASEQNEGDYL